MKHATQVKLMHLALVLAGFVAGVVLTSAYHADLGWRVWALVPPGAAAVLAGDWLFDRWRRGDFDNHRF